MFFVFLLFLPLLVGAKAISPTQVGAEQTALYFPQLKNKKVGLVVNQTSRAKNQHLVDLLVANHFDVEVIFAPEHGFRGDHDAGAKIESGQDAKTGIEIHSIYGKNKKPSNDIMANLDVVIFDIQDVGVRFYTYISSMFYMMQAAAENDVKFIILDRPNPNIAYVDGPMLNPDFRSFVGLLPVPIMHGMTVGELALMANSENWLNTIENPENKQHNLELTVIPVQQYSRADTYILPVKPSPNLPNAKSIELYPSLCFFEATPISIGRGTDLPFQIIGHNQYSIGKFEFTPRSIPGAASTPKLKGLLAKGQNLTTSDIQGFDLSLFYDWFQLFNKNEQTFFQYPKFMDKLAGTDQIRLGLLNGKTIEQLQEEWQSDLSKFKQARKPYLLYPSQ